MIVNRFDHGEPMKFLHIYNFQLNLFISTATQYH